MKTTIGELLMDAEQHYKLNKDGDLIVSIDDLRCGAEFETATLADLRLPTVVAHRANRVILTFGIRQRFLKNRWDVCGRDVRDGSHVPDVWTTTR